MSGLLLENGDFVACVYRGLADDFADMRACAIATKVVKTARKKFSKMTLKVFDREISAWDYFCHSRHTGAVAGADKFISDFIRLALMKRLDEMPQAELHLLALADIPFHQIDEATRLTPDSVFQRVHREVLRLVGEYGRSVAQLAARETPVIASASQKSIANGASP